LSVRRACRARLIFQGEHGTPYRKKCRLINEGLYILIAAGFKIKSVIAISIFNHRKHLDLSGIAPVEPSG